MRRLLFLCLFTSYSASFAGLTVQLLNNPVPCYEIAVISIKSSETIANPFTSLNLTAKFYGPDGSQFNVEGFYNGQMTWLIRFMPNKPGAWSYTWQFNDQHGAGAFNCVTKRNSKLHGHIRIDQNNPHKLRFEDGTPLHWIGGKYIDFDDPYYKTAERASVPERMPKAQYVPLVHSYLQAIAAKGLNGIVLKLRVLPLNDDLNSMDLDFLATVDQIMNWCLELGINVQLNFFDTWGKRKPGSDISIVNPPITDLLLEPHYSNTYVNETKFFFRYCIARYAAYPNLMWELWNEAEVMKPDPAMVKTAATLYASYFKTYDPYQTPIGASELQAGGYPIHITFFHAGFKCPSSDWNWTHTRTHNPALHTKWAAYAAYGWSNNRPILWNELYPKDDADPRGYLYATNTAAHNWFRASFWGNLTAGCVGTSEFCWANITDVPNKVTDYHEYFARFIGQIKDINLLDPADAEVRGVSGTATLCRYYGKEYVVYCFTQTSGSKSSIQLNLPAGNYYYDWYDPKTGQMMGTRGLHNQSSTGWISFPTPTYSQDIVFYLVEQSYSQTVVPVELAYFRVEPREGNVLLSWRTESESNNYGFAIERALASDTSFAEIGFVAGHGTTQMVHEYAFLDTPPYGMRVKYRLRQIDHDGTFSHSGTREIMMGLVQPESFTIRLFPNPARDHVQLQVSMTQPEELRFTIYNILQQTVYQSEWSALPPGVHTLRWDRVSLFGNRAPSGLYFYAVEPRSQKPVQSGKFLLLR